MSVPTSPLAVSSSSAYPPFAPLSPSIGHGASFLRGVSLAESIHEDDERDESGHTLKSVGEEDIDDKAYDGAGVDVSAGDEDDIDDDDDEDEEEEGGDGEVEYTLKDRQDVRFAFFAPPSSILTQRHGRQSTSSIRSVCQSGSQHSTRNHDPSPETPRQQSMRILLRPLSIISLRRTSCGPSSSDPGLLSSASLSAACSGVRRGEEKSMVEFCGNWEDIYSGRSESTSRGGVMR